MLHSHFRIIIVCLNARLFFFDLIFATFLVIFGFHSCFFGVVYIGTEITVFFGICIVGGGIIIGTTATVVVVIIVVVVAILTVFGFNNAIAFLGFRFNALGQIDPMLTIIAYTIDQWFQFVG